MIVDHSFFSSFSKNIKFLKVGYLQAELLKNCTLTYVELGKLLGTIGSTFSQLYKD